MIDPENIHPVADNELLARFIVFSNEKRDDGTVRPKLFLPYSRVDLSVNRHRDASIEETWQVGREVAIERRATLYGLANIRACIFKSHTLDVLPDPLPNNPNHANVVNYPPAKEEQMAIAQELAASIEGQWQRPPA